MLRHLLSRTYNVPVRLLSSTVSNTGRPDAFEGLISEIQGDVVSTRAERLPTQSFTSKGQLVEHLKKSDGFSTVEIIDVMRMIRAMETTSEERKQFVTRASTSLVLDNLNLQEVISIMTYLLRLDLLTLSLFKDLEQRCTSVPLNGNVSLVTNVLPFLAAVKESKYLMGEELRSAVHNIVLTQTRTLSKTADLLSLFNNYHTGWMNSSWLEDAATQARNLLQIMGVGELVSLVRCLSEHNRRDKVLLPLIVQQIIQRDQCLSINQLVVLAAACAKLNFCDARMMRRIGKDMVTDINQLHSWNDTSSLVNSFSRLRLGDSEAWKILAAWINGHLEAAPVKSVSIAVSGMARLGIQDGRSASAWLAQRLKRETSISQSDWLTAMHSLAYFETLTAQLAETVLNKDFVTSLIDSSKTDSERVYKAMRLLQVQAASKSLANYAGPTISKASFGDLLTGPTAISAAQEVKYSKKLASCAQENLVTGALLKLAPKTHIGDAFISESGILCDASVVIDSDDKLVPCSRWPDTLPRPVIYYRWSNLVQFVDIVGAVGESHLLGADQLSLRLLRAAGMKPIVVFDSQLVACSSQAEKVALLKELLTH